MLGFNVVSFSCCYGAHLHHPIWSINTFVGGIQRTRKHNIIANGCGVVHIFHLTWPFQTIFIFIFIRNLNFDQLVYGFASFFALLSFFRPSFSFDSFTLPFIYFFSHICGLLKILQTIRMQKKNERKKEWKKRKRQTMKRAQQLMKFSLKLFDSVRNGYFRPIIMAHIKRKEDISFTILFWFLRVRSSFLHFSFVWLCVFLSFFLDRFVSIFSFFFLFLFTGC